LKRASRDTLDARLLQYDLLRITSERGRIVPEAADHALVADLHADLPSSIRYQLAQTARLLREIEREVREMLWKEPGNQALAIRSVLERITAGDGRSMMRVTGEEAG
jgi:hypothetical protein